MKDIVGRFIFIIWIFCGFSVIVFGFAGKDDWVLVSAMLFIAPIVLGLLYVLIKWILTGKDE